METPGTVMEAVVPSDNDLAKIDGGKEIYSGQHWHQSLCCVLYRSSPDLTRIQILYVNILLFPLNLPTYASIDT